MSNDYFKVVKETLASMESGEYDFTENGKCIGCGACCSNILPVTEREIKNIKKFMKKNNIKEQLHVFPTNDDSGSTCPFLNMNGGDKKCVIYSVRPNICKSFMCNEPHGARNHPELYKEPIKIISVRDTFFGGKK